MKKYLASLLLLSLFLGCGESPSGNSDYIKNPNATDDNASNISIQDPTFKTIKSLVKKSQTGELDDVNYLCIGDSTRAYTVLTYDKEHPYQNKYNHSEKIFRDINNTLQNYGVHAYLLSQGGLEFKTFLGEKSYFENDTRDDWINIQEAIDIIPAKGEHTIVDISLGVNDISGLFHQYRTLYPQKYKADSSSAYPFIKSHLKALLLRTIHTLKESKPNIKIMLTSPNPYKTWESANKVDLEVYAEVANELKLPYANFAITMPKFDTYAFNNWFNDGIHFNEDIGMKHVSDFVIKQLLPTK